MGGHRIVAHPYISVAQSANGAHHNNPYPDGDDAAHPQQQIRRPTLAQRMTASFAAGIHSQGAHAMLSPQSLHTHSQPVLPSQAQRPDMPHHYDISPFQISHSHSHGYNQPPLNGAGHGYDLFAPRHSIDGSALGLTHAHAQMSIAHARASRPPITWPFPGTGTTTATAWAWGHWAGSMPDTEGGVSDGDTEESSGAPLSRFGSIASINGSEASWTSAYPSEGEDGDIAAAASRRMSCASDFLGMFSEMDGYVYPHNGAGGQAPEEDQAAMHDAYAAGAIELSHMCVPASEFMGGYVQYS
ncbi:hypothetical protein BN946_scf185037.g20 [Trametes cinnabarina]|uniref:Uncharacterized protein n=1 Tax=Pycnoporus cinnabarinus TaxID=5643 RepID=A0A060SNS5_PYCCI|nr:hypothetical protein BN946_scf185037.g20 [Trametes cinnabarina]